VTNLLEYALGLNPNAASVSGLPAVGQTNGFLTLTYMRVNSATDINYLPEVSGDLINWNGGTGLRQPVGAREQLRFPNYPSSRPCTGERGNEPLHSVAHIHP